MRSMSQALLWETFSHRRWGLPSFFLLAIMVPLLVYGALSGFPFDPKAHEFIVLQFAFLPVVIFQLAIGVQIVHGPHSRLFTMPISVNSIVACHTFSGAVILAAMTAAAAWLFNSLFHVNWPIAGPALFAAAAWSALQVLVSVSSRPSLPGFCVAGTPAILLCWWLLSRYGACQLGEWPSPPKHFWSELTPSEVITLLATFAICYVMTTHGVSLARCGESGPTFGVWNWISQRMEAYALSRTDPPPFRSAAHAQLWLEWQKGIALPLVTSLLLLVSVCGGLISWFMQTSSLDSLYVGLLILGGLISALALPTGIFQGLEIDSQATGQRETQLSDSLDRSELDYAMGNFLSSRPITSWEFATAALKSAARSTLLSWSMWLAVFVVCLLTMWLTNQYPNPLMPRDTGYLYLPLVFFGPWIALGNLGTIGLSGRGTKILFAMVITLVGYSVLMAVVNNFTSRSVVDSIHTCFTTVAAALVVVACIWAFFQAQRQQHFTSKVTILAGLAACLIVSIGFWLLPTGSHFIAYPMIFGFTALVVMPLATMPLAISWNRHRS
jgi:hypothetical protein